ncbi:hypothetical protein DRH29_00090 [candidate division Kazan bacterium]|uniref:Restriction endonuclease n=1 Tax=candidate division Kazan bacterium TaxID=2202143 RepID=A0A420ZDR3_UNCK3|nr:MAG: hypothetical protein DRH29_00090 [candidate division Kazan bacterium]
MNKWVKKSLDLAASPGYLDKLHDIYPVDISVVRQIGSQVEQSIKAAFKSRNKERLITTLLDLERFPIDEPYVGFIRKNRAALGRNPKTVRRIYRRLEELGLPGILEGVSKPPSPSRKMGPAFKKWLHSLGYPVLSAREILETREKIAVLSGSDAALKKFAKHELGYRGGKGLDLVMKVGETFLIGEAKFMSTGGGTQDKSFRESLRFVKSSSGNAIRIAVMDGIAWARPFQQRSSKSLTLYKSVEKLGEKQVVLSALLLKQFINSLA